MSLESCIVGGKDHIPREKSKILIGDRIICSSVIEIGDSFADYLIEVCNKLKNYNEIELRSVGIEPPQHLGSYSLKYKEDTIYFFVAEDNKDFKINVGATYKSGREYNTKLFGESDADLGDFSFSLFGSYVGKKTFEKLVSFSNEDSPLPLGISGYLDAVCLHPLTCVSFCASDDEKGVYSIVHKEGEVPEYRRGGTNPVAYQYFNADDSPYDPELFVCTTYFNFEMAMLRMKTNILAYQTAWNSALDELERRYPLRVKTCGVTRVLNSKTV